MAKPTNTMLAVAILIVASGVGGNGVTAGESAPLASVAQESEQPPPSLDQAADGVAQKAETAPEDTEGQSVTRAGEPEAFWRGVKTLISRLLGSRRRLVAFLNYARVQIAMFDATLQAFQLDIGDYPSTAQGLEALRTPPADLPNPDKWAGPYLAKPVPLDPWDNPYQYQYPGKHDPKKPDIWSFGPDGVDGTEDDVVSWVALEKFAPGGRRARKPIEFALVSGTVTLDGQPLADATLEFQPTRADFGSPSYGVTDINGRYELMYTFDKKGAMVGEHVVRITTGKEVQDEQGKAVVIEERLPAKYNTKSELRVTVERGTNTMNYGLRSE